MNETKIEQTLRLVPTIAAAVVLLVFTTFRLMKNFSPFMITPLVIMLVLTVGIDQVSHGASAEEGDDVTHVYVSGGSMSEPYFEFYADSEGTTEISELDITHTYTFHRLNGATSHPFYVSDSGYEQESSEKVSLTGDGSSNSGITGSETFTISFEEGFTVDDTLSFYCTVHSSMIGEFALSETVTLPNIPATAVSTGDHTSLVAALAHANLVGVLSGEGPYTVFAPTDSAFEEIGLNLSDFDTDEENATLAKILSYHVAMGSVMSSELEDGMEINSLIQEPITVNIYGQGAVVLNGEASVTTADVETSNGIIHIIDKVLMPPSESPDTPSEGEICYDMDTHTVDLTKTEENCDEMWIAAVDIPTTAAATTVHTSLVAAIAKANLTETLKGEGPFTAFAPTDEAFTAAGINLDDYDSDEKISALADILLMHVVSGKVMSSDLTDGMEATSLSGDTLLFMIGDTVSVNDATVTIADVPVSNGVIHVIDKVLMPVKEEEPKEEEPKEEEPKEEDSMPTCDHVIGLDSTGYAYSPASLTIKVGETVCWQWTDSADLHNVAEISSEGEQRRKEGGVNSGETAKTVDFRHTFTEATTFHYICEPHVGMQMVGKVVVSDTTTESEPSSSVTEKEEETPGFGLILGVLAVIGMALISRRL